MASYRSLGSDGLRDAQQLESRYCQSMTAWYEFTNNYSIRETCDDDEDDELDDGPVQPLITWN